MVWTAVKCLAETGTAELPSKVFFFRVTLGIVEGSSEKAQAPFCSPSPGPCYKPILGPLTCGPPRPNQGPLVGGGS